MIISSFLRAANNSNQDTIYQSSNGDIPAMRDKPRRSLLCRPRFTHQLHQAALMWLRGRLDHPIVHLGCMASKTLMVKLHTHLVQVDGMHIQSLARCRAVLGRSPVHPLHHSVVRAGVAHEEVPKANKLWQFDGTILCPLDGSALCAQRGEVHLGPELLLCTAKHLIREDFSGSLPSQCLRE